MTIEELKATVPVYCRPGQLSYVRLIDIPNPYRSEFAVDSIGSTLPLIDGETDCYYAHDWMSWLGYRAIASYALRFPDRYELITDAVLQEKNRGMHQKITNTIS
jgi:hypothetical protein